MKILKFILFLLLIPALGWAETNQYIASQSVASGGCGSTGLVDENFDTTGYCVFGNEALGGTNTMDEDDTTDPVSSPYDLKLVWNEDNTATAYAGHTQQTGITYYRVKIKVLGDFSATFAYSWFFSANNSTSISGPTAAFSLRVGQTGASNARIGLFNSAGVGAQYFDGSTGTWYEVLIKYYSDGSTATEWKVDDAGQTSVASTENEDPAYVWIGGGATEQQANNTNGILIDDIRVSTNSADIGW